MQEHLALKSPNRRGSGIPLVVLCWMQALRSVELSNAVGVTELDEEAVVAQARDQFVRTATTIQPRGLGQEAPVSTAAAQSTALDGDGRGTPRAPTHPRSALQGKQGADMHSSASYNGCACHSAEQAPLGPDQGYHR